MRSSRKLNGPAKALLLLREAQTPNNGPRITKLASVVRRPKNVHEESRRRRPAASAHPQVREYSGICRRRIYPTPRPTTGSPRFSTTATSPPHKSRARASLQREPYRSRLKPTAFCRSSRPIVLSSSTTEMAKDGGPDWNGLLKWSLAHGDGTNQPRALRSAPRVSRSYASSSFLRLSSSCAKTLTNA